MESCAACHRIIDSPGFALESFDVIGGWRNRYRAIENGDEPAGDPQLRSRYMLRPAVDATGETTEGETFKDIDGFRKILLAKEEQIARNVAENLLIYATGGGIEFADREAVSAILARAKDKNYGLRTLIHAVVESDVFLKK